MYKLVAAILVGNGVGGRMVTAPHYTFYLTNAGVLVMETRNINF